MRIAQIHRFRIKRESPTCPQGPAISTTYSSWPWSASPDVSQSTATRSALPARLARDKSTYSRELLWPEEPQTYLAVKCRETRVNTYLWRPDVTEIGNLLLDLVFHRAAATAYDQVRWESETAQGTNAMLCWFRLLLAGRTWLETKLCWRESPHIVSLGNRSFSVSTASVVPRARPTTKRHNSGRYLLKPV